MVVADIFCLIFVTIYEVNQSYFPYSFLSYFSICRLILVFSFASIHCSVWFTVAFTFDRFVAIRCQKLRSNYCTTKTATVVLAVVCSLCILQTIPFYFAYEPLEITNNMSWFCTVSESNYTTHLWSAFIIMETVLTPFVPFILISLLNLLTIRHIVQVNRMRKALRGNENVQKQRDPEIENRRKSMVLLLAISGSFILLWSVNVLTNVYTQFVKVRLLSSNFHDPFTILEKCGYMLQAMSCCVNTFIYIAAQRKFREEVINMIKRPLSLFMRLLK